MLNFSSVAETVRIYLDTDDSASVEDYKERSDDGDDNNDDYDDLYDDQSTMDWIWEQNSNNESLGQRMWQFSVKLRQTIGNRNICFGIWITKYKCFVIQLIYMYF